MGALLTLMTPKRTLHTTIYTEKIRDMELVVGSCLRSIVFDNALREHADPNAERIAALQASGRLPKTLSEKTILDDVDMAIPSPSSGL